MLSKMGLIRKKTQSVVAPDTELDLSASAQDMALNEMSDEMLMLAYVANDKLAFDKLYERFRLPLFRYMRSQIRVQEEILNELYQDVWLKLINNRKKYQVKASFKTFLYQIAINTIRDYFRRESVRKIMSTIEDDAEVESGDLLPDEDLSQKQVMEKFRKILNDLPKEQRDVFLLREEAGLTSVQIADVMQTSVDTVKSRMRYAVTRLKEAVK